MPGISPGQLLGICQVVSPHNGACVNKGLPWGEAFINFPTVGSFTFFISCKLMLNLREVLQAALHFLSIHGHIFVCIFVGFFIT